MLSTTGALSLLLERDFGNLNDTPTGGLFQAYIETLHGMAGLNTDAGDRERAKKPSLSIKIKAGASENL